jgi:hypothetical protein
MNESVEGDISSSKVKAKTSKILHCWDIGLNFETFFWFEFQCKTKEPVMSMFLKLKIADVLFPNCLFFSNYSEIRVLQTWLSTNTGL